MAPHYRFQGSRAVPVRSRHFLTSFSYLKTTSGWSLQLRDERMLQIVLSSFIRVLTAQQ